MNTEIVLSSILPKVETLLKETIKQATTAAPAATLYDLEALTQKLLPQLGQVVLQGLVDGQGAGVVGPERPCACGAIQHYHDRAHPLSVPCVAQRDCSKKANLCKWASPAISLRLLHCVQFCRNSA